MITTRILVVSSILLYGCGSTTDRQTQVVETQRTTTAPLVVDSPFGQFVVQPAQVTVQRTQREVETTTKTLDMPDVGGAIMTAASGTPWGGILAGITGLATAAFAVKDNLTNTAKAKKLIKAQSDYADDLEDAETDSDVVAVKAKHAEKQKALGIHEDLAKARHTA